MALKHEHCIFGFDQTRKHVVFVCTETTEYKPVKLEIGHHTVILPPMVSVLCFNTTESLK